MNLSNLDTSKFLYDPKNSDSYGNLKKYKEFTPVIKGLLGQKVVQYVIIMYDPASGEVTAEYPFLPQRKLEVARMVGLCTKNAPPIVENMLIGQIPEVSIMIVKYLSFFDDPEITMLAAYKEIFVSLNRAAFNGDTDNNLIKNIDLVKNSITVLTDNVLRGKDETRLRADLYRSIEGRDMGIRVEEIAEKLKRGEEPFPNVNPYGEDYKMEPLKFSGDK